jgi:cell division protein FtsQ
VSAKERERAASAESREPERSRRRRIARLVALAVAVAALVGAPWWGPSVLSSLAFFRVRNVQVEGVRYLPARDVVALLRVDSTASVWDDLAPYERRVAAHPQVATVQVARKLPATLVVRVEENLPTALVPGPGGALRAVDGRGRTLPIDPSRVTVDLPVVVQRDAQGDTAILRLLGELRDVQPGLFARVSEARRVGKGELQLQLTASAEVAPGGVLPVRAMADVSAGRLAEIHPVEQDLQRRGLRAAEIDLRYRDQVIARLQ